MKTRTRELTRHKKKAHTRDTHTSTSDLNPFNKLSRRSIHMILDVHCDVKKEKQVQTTSLISPVLLSSNSEVCTATLVRYLLLYILLDYKDKLNYLVNVVRFELRLKTHIGVKV